MKRRMTFKLSKSVSARDRRPKNRKKRYCGKLGLHWDHHHVKIKFCMGQSSRVVLSFQFSSKWMKWFQTGERSKYYYNHFMALCLWPFPFGWKPA